MDFGSSVYKSKPGLKSYLFISDYANVIDELMHRCLDCTYVNRLEHPFTQTDFELIMGVSEDTQGIIVKTDGLTSDEQDIIARFLANPKVKNLSVYLCGSQVPSEEIRMRVSKQGLYINAVDPTTYMSRKHLSEWLGDECKIHVSDAYKVAERLDWNLGAVVWTMKSYQAVSGGKVLDRNTAQKILNLISFEDPVAVVFQLTVQKKKAEGVALARLLTQEQTEELIDRLRDFLQGISVVSEAVKYETSDKKISAASGRSINDVVFLQPFLSRYSFATVTRCNKLLNFAQQYIEQTELAETVVLLWAS